MKELIDRFDAAGDALAAESGPEAPFLLTLWVLGNVAEVGLDRDALRARYPADATEVQVAFVEAAIDLKIASVN